MLYKHILLWDQYEQWDEDNLACDDIIVPAILGGCAVISMDSIGLYKGRLSSYQRKCDCYLYRPSIRAVFTKRLAK